MSYCFFCKGHPNIKSEHKNTLEFTKDEHLTPSGDCIVGVEADYELDELFEFISDKKSLDVEIIVDDSTFSLECDLNEEFKDNEEIVIRRTQFLSDRTLGINATHAAVDMPRDMVEKIKDKNKKIKVVFS